jgi:hypothetical protein
MKRGMKMYQIKVTLLRKGAIPIKVWHLTHSAVFPLYRAGAN